MEKKNLQGLFIMLGLMSIAVGLPVAIHNYTTAYRNVTVKGLCEKEVVADRAIWPIIFKEGGNDLMELTASVAAKDKKVVKWLLDAGFSKDEISVASPKIEDLRTNSWNERITYNYVMTSIITVCSDKVETVLKMQKKQIEMLGEGIALGSGNSWENPVEFSYTALNEIKPEMIEQATLNAREAAEKFAKDSGAKVGDILTASQGQFSISDRDSNTPYIKTIRVVTTINYQLK